MACRFLCKAPDAQAKRERISPPITLFWAFQVLNPAMPCQDVLARGRFARYRERYRHTDEHNAQVPRDHWLEV